MDPASLDASTMLSAIVAGVVIGLLRWGCAVLAARQGRGGTPAEPTAEDIERADREAVDAVLGRFCGGTIQTADTPSLSDCYAAGDPRRGQGGAA